MSPEQSIKKKHNNRIDDFPSISHERSREFGRIEEV